MNHRSNRRNFLRQCSLATPGIILASRANTEKPEATGKLFSAMGMAAPLDRAAPLKALGAEFLTVSTTELLAPDKPEEFFEKKLALIATSPLPVLACNGFIRPAHLRCVGTDANHDPILEWAETSFRRLKKAGGKFIVFGSSGSRQLRDGWPKEKADAQFTALLKRMGPLAEKHGVTVVVEQLRDTECNYINHIGEGAALIRAAGHPNIRLLADLYHMAVMGDSPADLKAAMDVVRHVEIAEKGARTYPGVAGDDFRPFFRVLREAGYQGAINIEGKGVDSQIAAAFKELAKQATEA